MSTLPLAAGVVLLIIVLFGLAYLISGETLPQLPGDQQSPPPAPADELIRLPYQPVAKRIGVFVGGPFVEYEETWVYAPGDFEKVVQNITLARQASADEVLDRLCGFAARVYSLGGFAVDEEEKSVTLSLAMYPVVNRVENRVVVDLAWLFQSLRVDLTLLDFRVEGNILRWQGELQGVPTTIVIELPALGEDYAPNGEHYGFSEYKVWWTEAAPGEERAPRLPPGLVRTAG